ncbi:MULTISPECIES: hypothetical protein [Okeania]|uniref:hypothetical protein n=1 Tax=Okeania TaxID=1458928 RepID=UPI000F5497F1|nr:MULTISPECIES: hypothetical protein [Okeania]NES88426.1 hypothetical protein [Okeania sp. SIO2B9]NET78703.1 hypothetical protein [Okeania sp. SIO1F9]
MGHFSWGLYQIWLNTYYIVGGVGEIYGRFKVNEVQIMNGSQIYKRCIFRTLNRQFNRQGTAESLI